ncbi:hypothetical protein CC85DRAFT_283837 [Cutaneotrichosporon oleaginosum]|uniref:Secreted protein n=1 Tax=Cutaneotrichosporon oleaginosum TaxID=879819 RepID=A0A0J0XSM7_9TREE|nr:uncharacterized protein CC85DRAFT_283837 [Cutaneotrichosporon oleaginosum]KLT44060.1 hypothetical protein CC85DRAFT_283837 [Cutaneotrichosporon oleaginosum]TXT09483.1 hypothetical protein COLE_03417 [Cutaneotrichosporon oleaginosum]
MFTAGVVGLLLVACCLLMATCLASLVSPHMNFLVIFPLPLFPLTDSPPHPAPRWFQVWYSGGSPRAATQRRMPREEQQEQREQQEQEQQEGRLFRVCLGATQFQGSASSTERVTWPST